MSTWPSALWVSIYVYIVSLDVLVMRNQGNRKLCSFVGSIHVHTFSCGSRNWPLGGDSFPIGRHYWPPWITNDCLGTAFIVVHRRWRHEAKYGIYWIYLIILSHIVLVKVSIPPREIFWSLLTFHANYTSSQSHDINSLVICTDG
jgi:CDP-diglyceride synthetase